MKSYLDAVKTLGRVPADWHQIGNGDLTPLILCRLPAKSVIKFRCVCRQWLSITSDPQFLMSHTLCNPHPPIDALILQSGRLLSHPLPGRRLVPSLSFIPADCFGDDRNSVITLRPLDSCNGLVLLIGPKEHGYPYYVCNPTTKDWRRIPEPPTKTIVAAALFFDPSSSVCLTPLLHYKIVSIVNDGHFGVMSEYKILIYSSHTESWNTFGRSFSKPQIFTHRSRSGVCCGGSVHWFSGSDSSNDTVSLSFQMESGRLRSTPFPGIEGVSTNIIKYFGSSGNRLHLILRFGNETDLLHIFELNSDHSGWIPLYCLKMEEGCIYGSRLVCFFRLGTREILLVSHETEDDRKKLITYHLGEKFIYYESNYMPMIDYAWDLATPFAYSLYSP